MWFLWAWLAVRVVKWNRVTDFGLLPHPIAGQPGIFRLIPSLARKTHHSTVSWRPVGWHPAMDTRACFCSNIEKSRHILDWTRTSISELSVRHSTIELHLQSEDNLFAVSVFLWSGIPESHRWLLHGKETSCCYTKPAISSKHSWLFRTCCCYNKEYSIIVVGAPTGFCHRVYGLEGHHSASELWVLMIYCNLNWNESCLFFMMRTNIFI